MSREYEKLTAQERADNKADFVAGLVEGLEELLAEAKAGKVHGIAAIYVGDDEAGFATLGSALNGSVGLQLLGASLHLQQVLMRKVND